MKKYNSLLTMAIIGATFSSGAFAADGVSVNQELSDVRVKISKQMLENRLYQAELDGLQKKQEIQAIKNSLDGVSSTSSSGKTIESSRVEDHTFQFNETLNEEDILSEGNNWKQSVGFIYQDDLDIGAPVTNQIGGNNAISELTESGDDLDFAAMLEEVASEAKNETDESEEVHADDGLSNVNDFKLIGVELSKLNIYEEKRKGSLKVNYITNNGYQKIRGSKIVNVMEGSKFNVKGKVAFEVLSIDDTGITFKNVKSDEIEKATR